MQAISMLDFRRDAEGVLRRVMRGQTLVLTYRGQPAVRLEPLPAPAARADDPFYRLAELADATGEPLDNAAMDRIVYGTEDAP